jgi:DNA-binding ferritin-like protein (Dps family)
MAERFKAIFANKRDALPEKYSKALKELINYLLNAD